MFVKIQLVNQNEKKNYALQRELKERRIKYRYVARQRLFFVEFVRKKKKIKVGYDQKFQLTIC